MPIEIILRETCACDLIRFCCWCVNRRAHNNCARSSRDPFSVQELMRKCDLMRSRLRVRRSFCERVAIRLLFFHLRKMSRLQHATTSPSRALEKRFLVAGKLYRVKALRNRPCCFHHNSALLSPVHDLRSCPWKIASRGGESYQGKDDFSVGLCEGDARVSPWINKKVARHLRG
jgi:hypothetical protein